MARASGLAMVALHCTATCSLCEMTNSRWEYYLAGLGYMQKIWNSGKAAGGFL
jgi:hypothetical protein